MNKIVEPLQLTVKLNPVAEMSEVEKVVSLPLTRDVQTYYYGNND